MVVYWDSLLWTWCNLPREVVGMLESLSGDGWIKESKRKREREREMQKKGRGKRDKRDMKWSRTANRPRVRKSPTFVALAARRE